MKTCRFCHKAGLEEFIDLYHQPPSNSFLTKEQLLEPEVYYPLKLFVCPSCWLVQIDEYKKADEIFNEDYVYYSSQSPANVSHAKEYVEMVMDRFHPERVLEIGSNDGYLLQHFPKSIEVCGIDMAKGPVEIARMKGIPGVVGSFGTFYANGMIPYDLICGINVLAHQPDINDFVEGLRIALAPTGIITMEFPHLMNLIDQCQFDTIYHEHYSYFSFGTICQIFHRHGLAVFDVDEIPEHGGSLRIYAKHEPSDWFSPKMAELLKREQDKGVFHINYYRNFERKVGEIKYGLVDFLISTSPYYVVAAYGAPAKGNTLLNYCGIRQDLILFTVDRSPHKIGKYLPGSHIPVYDEEYLKKVEPDYVLILPWNLKEEIMEQLKYIREWGGTFVVAVPKLEEL